jgi:hypothetical protein
VLLPTDFNRSAAGHVWPESGSDVAASATRVRTFCAVGWESPTGVSDLWRFLSMNRAPPTVTPDDGGGCLRAPKDPSNPTIQSTRRPHRV